MAKASVAKLYVQKGSDSIVATWTWSKASTTDHYATIWKYAVGDGTWYEGTREDISANQSRQSLYSPPANATRVYFRVRPIAKKKKVNNKEQYQWTAEWSTAQIFNINRQSPPGSLGGAPSLEIINYTLRAQLTDLVTSEIHGTHIKFQVVQDDRTTGTSSTNRKVFKEAIIPIYTEQALFTCSVTAGHRYKVRACVSKDKNGSQLGPWTNFGEDVYTPPTTPTGLTVEPKSITSQGQTTYGVNVKWKAVGGIDISYTIQYANNKDILYTDEASSVEVEADTGTAKYITGLDVGHTYYFRIRANNSGGSSAWSSVVSCILGKKPEPPTTWSSADTAKLTKVQKEGVNPPSYLTKFSEPLYLYWIHNSTDGSLQTYALIDLKVTIKCDDDVEREFPLRIPISDDRPEEEKLKTYQYLLSENAALLDILSNNLYDSQGNIVSQSTKSDPTAIKDIKSIKWRVQTAGVELELDKLSDFSVEREINTYQQPTLTAQLENSDGDAVYVAEEFPLYVHLTSGPEGTNQTPIGYTINISAVDAYEIVNNEGKDELINAGQSVFRKYIDTLDSDGNPLFDDIYDILVELNPGNISLQNNVLYNYACEVTMNSGITVSPIITGADTQTDTFFTAFSEIEHSPDALVSYDQNRAICTITPFVDDEEIAYCRVFSYGTRYRKYENIILDDVSIQESDLFVDDDSGNPILTYDPDHPDDPGDYIYVTDNDVLFSTIIRNDSSFTGLISVYRREFDGQMTEIGKNIPSNESVTVIDPHPSLDYARYRIVAIDSNSGSVSYTDLPGLAIDEPAIIIQWDEEYSSFDTQDGENSNNDPVENHYSGSMLKLPYNVDISEQSSIDVEEVQYVGRKHPVSYYGTQVGQSHELSTDIPKEDKETIYALRRLQVYMGDVYVREPSGIGYWANISVSFSQTHCEVVVPVSISITRVEGGA